MSSELTNLPQQLRGRASFVRKRGEIKNADLMEQAAAVLDAGTPIPAKVRKQAERDAKRAAGLVRIEMWAYPSDHAAIRKHAAELARQHAQQARTLRSVK